MPNTLTKILVIAIFVLILVSGFLYMSNQALSAKNEKLEFELTICSNSLSEANIKIVEANKVNVEQSKIVAKYNSMKKKDYKNANDTDLDALHTLDVLLESKSIIE